MGGLFAKAKNYNSQLNDPEYKGEPISEELQNGPFNKRSCTDIIFCILFVVFIVAMVIIFLYAVANGQPQLLALPVDSDGISLQKN
jgi:solute carrier family 44 (choline transporter-like protein), member 2/4/5